MKPKNLFMKRVLVALAFTALTQIPVWATPTENTGIRVLPVPGAINIDGKANDWDLSGGIFASDDVENQRDAIAVWMHAMYDRDNLYLLARFRDETPLNNPGQTIADYGFAGDSLQFRVITGFGTASERVSHWTGWQGRDNRDVMDVAYGKNFNEGGIKDAKTQGAQQAFSKEADGKGYLQEMAIPWKLLTKDGAVPDAATGFRLTIEPNFTVGLNGRMSLKDIFQPNIRPDRVFTFQNSTQWGPATLEPKGKVAPKPVRLADAREFPVVLQNGVPTVNWKGLIKTKEMPGFKVIAFTMPADGYISLNIKDRNGVVVRQLLNSAFYAKGRHEVKWDGLTTPSAGMPGQPVAVGEYSWSALWNTGIGLKLRGWAANGGSTPWDNGPGTNWGGDHGDPIAAATDDTQVYLGWAMAEAGQSLIACDLNGNVKWNHRRGGISGVKSVAADGGIVYVLGGKSGLDSDGGALYKLNAADGKYLSWGDSEDADLHIKNLWPDNKTAPDKADFVAAGGGKIYLSFTGTSNVVVLDGKTGRQINILNVPKPGALQISGGKLYAIAEGKRVEAYDLTNGGGRTAVDGLTNATALAVRADRIYVGTREPDNQVKVFDLQGKALSTLGRAGGRNLSGKWTPDGLRFIQSIALAADGKLWVAEQDSYPRRMSAWDTKTATLWKEFFGETTYGALGGAINPLDPNVMVGQGCEWRLDPKTGQATCMAVITRAGMENSRFGVGNNGRLYLAIAPAWIHDLTETSIFERLGEGEYKLRSKFIYEGQPRKTRLWADANGDEKEQDGESTTADGYLRFSGWYMAFTPNMTIYASNKQMKVQGFTPAGAPRYDIAHPVVMPGEVGNAGMGSSAGLGTSDDKIMLYNGQYGVDRTTFAAYDIASGKIKWTYPNNFVGVHGSHNATPAEVGMIRGAYDLAGTAKLPAPIGNIWVIPTNVGEWHILTEDGFYLTKLFQGDPLKQKWPSQAIPGAPMNDVPPGSGGEDFGGSIAYGKDGKLYLQAGKTAFWNLEVTGLDTVRALSGDKITIAAQDLTQAQAFREAGLQQSIGKKMLAVKKSTVAFTGNLSTDFKAANTVAFQKSDDAAVRSSVAWDDQNLYLAWDVTDNTPWQNSAKMPEEMYTTGDTVDFQLGTDPAADNNHDEAVAGDLRLSIGSFNGAPTVVLYRKVAATKKPKTFSSGVVKSYTMDYVDIVRDAKINLVKRDNGYLVEAAIPLSALGFKPAEGQTRRGDLGVTYGGEGGGRTRLRVYWNNQHTGIVDDAVFELMMEPKNWGELQFVPK
jgi:hypothetical protein